LGGFARRNVFLLGAAAWWALFSVVHFVGTVHQIGEEARRWAEPFAWSAVWWEYARASAENYKTEAWQIGCAHLLDRLAAWLGGLDSQGKEQG
jgi:hypothetical protein